MISRTVTKACLLVCVLVMAAMFAPAKADTVLYSTGFEAPTFVTGPIAGQDGWSTFGTSSAAQVENTFAKTGTQAVEVIPALAASQTGPYHTNVTTGPLVDLSADIYLASSTVQSEFQFAALGPGLVGFLGGINILGNNSIQLETAGSPLIGTFTRNSWQHVDLLFDIPTQTYNVSINNTLLASNVPFCGANGACSGAVLSTYANGFFDTFGNASNNDIGYIDNYAVTLVGAPEPSTTALILAGALLTGLVLKRKGWSPARD